MLDFSVTFFITIINIVILCLILRAILFKPVTKFMADRARRVQDSIEQSEKDKAQANALLVQYTAHLKTAETEAEAGKIIAESRVSADQILINARKQIETEQKAAMSVFRKEAAAIVMAASGLLVGREITGGDNSQYASMLLEEASHKDKAGTS